MPAPRAPAPRRAYPRSVPTIHPFHAVTYADASRLSALIAPPYDVLDAAGKQALLAKDARNIVAVDLPHIPAKELGPPAAYTGAAETFRSWLGSGVMTRRPAPALFVYRQTFSSATGTHRVQRTGLVCTVDLVPFGPRAGGGVLPHEETFSGPKEDRLALMKASATQFSPIFGLHEDTAGKAARQLATITRARRPEFTADTGDGVLHEVWSIEDPASIKACTDALAGEDLFVADGHHRYNTALNYVAHLEASGQKIGPDHPARKIMMVLVGMSDAGLVIWPTHRLLGGMAGYSWDAFLKAAGPHLRFEPIAGDLADLEQAVHRLDGMGNPRLGVHDFATGKQAVVIPAASDPLAARFADKPREWRDLDVAMCQHLLVEQIAQPALNAGNPVKWAFPHTLAEVKAIAAGHETGAGGGKGFTPQLGVILRPTPLGAVRSISRAGVLMPQKSTFFYPKLATGLFVNPLS
jgi:uncharacterized protein (DUF1015 family)